MDREDLKRAMQTAQEVQLGIVKVQEELAHTEIVGESTNSLVKITMNAQGEFHNLKIDPLLLAEGLTALERSILQAVRDAANQSHKLTQEKLKAISKKIGL